MLFIYNFKNVPILFCKLFSLWISGIAADFTAIWTWRLNAVMSSCVRTMYVYTSLDLQVWSSSRLIFNMMHILMEKASLTKITAQWVGRFAWLCCYFKNTTKYECTPLYTNSTLFKVHFNIRHFTLILNNFYSLKKCIDNASLKR